MCECRSSQREKSRGEAIAASGEGESQRRPDPLDDGVEIAVDLLIAERQGLHARAFEDFGAPPVAFREAIALLAVDLDRAFCSVTIEVDDITIERSSPFELGAVKTGAAQPLPRNPRPMRFPAD